MSGTYTLKILTDFASAHTLRNYPGKCSQLHGHNWKLEVHVTATALDNTGMAIDFKEIKKAAKIVTAELDHRYLNEIKPFDEINPTAENIASYIYKGIGEIINNDRVTVSAVTLWETDRSCVTYSEN